MGHPESRKLSWGALVLLWLLQEEAVGSSLPERKGAGADLQLGSPLGLSAIAGFIIFVWPVHYRTSAWNRRDGQLNDDSTSAMYFNRDAFEDYLEITVDKDSSNLPADEYIATGSCTYIVGWIQGSGAIIGEHSQIGERKTRETTPENKRTQISQDFSGRSLTIDTLTDNETQIVEDNHSYYLSRIYGPQENRAKELWVEVAEANRSQVKIHGILSNTHRQASRVILSFDFPFYGHYLRQVTIATGGFIFMGDVIHRMLTATQYIAPLMANFNPGYSRNSTVKYFDNGTMFVVQWDQVYLEGKEDKGCFVFQAALYNSGRIVFGYKEIPMSVLEISSTQHPVKAGLSDAFMILNSSPESQHRTIYEYHRVELDTSKITSASAVEFLPLPTCLQLHNCETCMTSGLNFNCSWCHVLQRCSSGFDRYHEEWLEYGCGQESEEKTCADFEEDEHYMSSTPNHSAFTPLPEDTITSSSQFIDSLTTEDDTKLNQNPGEEVLRDHVPTKKGGTQIHTGTIVGILLAVLLIAAIILAGIYITSNPTSSAALFFIERRPHQWPTMKFRNRSPYTEVEPSGQEKDSFVEADQC